MVKNVNWKTLRKMKTENVVFSVILGIGAVMSRVVTIYMWVPGYIKQNNSISQGL